VNIYITFNNKHKIKKCFLNLRKYLIINSDDIIEQLGFDKNNMDSCRSFIINSEILKMIKSGANSKKLLGIIYINSSLTDEIARSIIHHIEETENINKVIFLTERGDHEEYYELFEEVMFFPTLKKVHIIECKSVPGFYTNGSNDIEIDNYS
jgi:hypothetical protein